jgi:MFS family permease
MNPASIRPDPHAHARFAQSKPLLWLIAAGFFMQTLDSTIVNTAAPRIAEALGATPLGMRTALTSYVLTLAVLVAANVLGPLKRLARTPADLGRPFFRE